MKKFIAGLCVAVLLGLVGCSVPVAAPASTNAAGTEAPSTAAAEAAEALERPTSEPSDPLGLIVKKPVPGAQRPAAAAPTMSVDEVCNVWKQGFQVLNEGAVTVKEAMAPLEEATAAAPPEIRVQSGIATRILWGQLMYPSHEPPSDETLGYFYALRQACYDLTGMDVLEGLDR